MKFKIGDRVKLITSRIWGSHGLSGGTITKIVFNRNKTYIYVLFDDWLENNQSNFYENELEFTEEFKNRMLIKGYLGAE